MECAICLEKIDIKERAVLNCHHSFHQSCIQKNIKYSNKCPYCRQEIRVIIFRENLDHSITKYYDLEEDLDIIFNGFYYWDTKTTEGCVSAPLFLENDSVKKIHEISLLHDLEKYIKINHFKVLISWCVEVVYYLNNKYKFNVNLNDFKFLLILSYYTLKKYSHNSKVYQLVALGAVYHYMKLNDCIYGIDGLDEKILIEELHWVSLNTYNPLEVSEMINYQRKFL